MKWLFPSVIVLLSAVPAALSADIGVAPGTLAGPAASFLKGSYGLDEEGVLVFDYGHSYNNLGKFRNPYFISNYANMLYREYADSGKTDEDAKKRFLVQAEYLLKSAVLRGETARWEYPFPQPKYGLKPGWISGIGQSRIAGVLIRAAGITGRAEFAEAAQKAMTVYLKSPQEGGVATQVGATTWIEEAPNPDGGSYKILNGHITGLTGILDYYQITKDPVWKDLFDRGVEAVRRDIASFDLGHTSLYALGYIDKPFRAKRKSYHQLHIYQLLWLNRVTGDDVFTEWASRFTFNLINPINGSDMARYAPVANECNHTPAEGYFAHLGPFRRGPEFKVRCDGWVVFQRGTATALRVAATGAGKISVSVSDRFSDWRPLGDLPTDPSGAEIALPHDRFVRLSFEKTVSAITSISASGGELATGLDQTWLESLRKSISVLRY